jgi:peptidoglycan/xylan/chitin deacetylase (PgdA/CDA1 family)
MPKFGNRIYTKLKLALARRSARRLANLITDTPIVSFTFDDFPSNAADLGARLLDKYKFRGTFFVSAGLLDSTAPTGQICSPKDIQRLYAGGHEIGSHTYEHLDAWITPAKQFELSLLKNASAIADIVPGCKLSSFSYPISYPSTANKRVAGRHFAACRAGGQTTNLKTVDLNALRSFFIEKTDGSVAQLKSIIDYNSRVSGWLIFSTHDISVKHTRFGCHPDVFNAILEYTKEHGGKVMPVSQVIAEHVRSLGIS